MAGSGARGLGHFLRYAVILGIIIESFLMPAPQVAAAPSQPPARPSFGRYEETKDESVEHPLRLDAQGRYTLSWQDQSNDEDGFLVEVTFRPGGERFSDRVAANTTMFVFPESVPFGFRSPEECFRRSDVAISVRAFNQAGRSEPAELRIQRECFDVVPQLPRTGAIPPSVPLIGAAAMIVVGLGLVTRRYRV